MKRFLIIAFVVLGMVLSGAAFAQQMSPATPIAPSAPTAPPPTVSPATPVAPPAQTPVPVAQKPFSDFWVGMSVDVGTPYTGMIAKFNSNFEEAGGGSPFTVDGIANLDIGATPLDMGTIHFGGMVRFSAAFSYTDVGDWSGYAWDGSELVSDTLHESGTTFWASISPMAAIRFQTNGNNFILLAAGFSYFSYGDVTTSIWDDDGYLSTSATDSSSGVAGANGWEPSLLLQATFSGGSAEVGLNGPDLYVGAGFVF